MLCRRRVVDESGGPALPVVPALQTQAVDDHKPWYARAFESNCTEYFNYVYHS